MCDKVQFDLSGEFENRSYKSCFAQSMAVHSQSKQPKSLDYQQFEPRNRETDTNRNEIFTNRSLAPEIQEVIRLRKNSRSILDDTRRYSCSNINSTRRSSLCSSRIAEIPVENIVNQSKMETLQWQLKEIRKSREMYRAVMKQVVTYLEKAHHSLELLGTRMNRRASMMHRSRSEHQMDNSWGLDLSSNNPQTTTGPNRTLDEHQLKDLQWQQNKPEGASPEEIPPDKLASEAFRLWRTARSLLNTQEPDLDREDDFLSQLAKEFPPQLDSLTHQERDCLTQPHQERDFLTQPHRDFLTQSQSESRPQRATSFSLSPKLIATDADARISTAFNRKLSLQLGDARRISKVFRPVDSARGSVAESDSESLCGQKISKSDKLNSPASGSVSSVEDESGFSSMNSFQEVGLPLVNSTMTEEVSTKNALLRSMLHNNSDYSSLNFSINHENLAETAVSEVNCENQARKELRKGNIDEIRLWQKPSPTSSINTSTPQHKRWYSSPVDEPGMSQSVKVLWV